MKITQAHPAIKVVLSIAFCLAALGQAPMERLKPIQTPFLVISVATLFASILLTMRNFKQGFVPHSVIAISSVFLGGWTLSHLGSMRFASLIGSFMIWGGVCYSVVAVGIYLRQWRAFGK